MRKLSLKPILAYLLWEAGIILDSLIFSLPMPFGAGQILSHYRIPIWAGSLSFMILLNGLELLIVYGLWKKEHPIRGIT